MINKERPRHLKRSFFMRKKLLSKDEIALTRLTEVFSLLTCFGDELFHFF